MKFIKTVLLFAFIGLIAVSCKETKKEELKDTIDVVDEGYESTESAEPTEVKESKEATESTSITKKKATQTSEAAESEKKTKTHIVVEETSSKDLVELKIEDDEILLETAADTPVIYPGCSGGTNEEIRACSRKSFTIFFGENFNSNVVDELEDMEAGLHTMRALLKIDKTGNISVKKVLAERKELEEEFRRVIALYPMMTPAVKNGKAVDVKFVLPIKFKVLN